jgi:hypothetical protein
MQNHYTVDIDNSIADYYSANKKMPSRLVVDQEKYRVIRRAFGDTYQVRRPDQPLSDLTYYGLKVELSRADDCLYVE